MRSHKCFYTLSSFWSPISFCTHSNSLSAESCSAGFECLPAYCLAGMSVIDDSRLTGSGLFLSGRDLSEYLAMDDNCGLTGSAFSRFGCDLAEHR